MLRRPILMLLVLSGCGEPPLDPAVASVDARVINLSGLPGEVAIWMDGEVIAGGLIDSQPGQPLSIATGEHVFGYSAAGADRPEVTATLSIPENSFILIALMPGQSQPELRAVAYPPPGQGKITVRALNASDELVQVKVNVLIGAPGGPTSILEVEPGAARQIDVAGSTTIRVGSTQTVSPTVISLQTGRIGSAPGELHVFGPLDLGVPVSGDVRTVVFHRSPDFRPDVYSF